ncbi:unnamed protein product [Amaranthus hypochondriacus]
MICKKEAFDVRVWFTEILDETKADTAELLATLLWQIWFARNELCFEKVYTSPEVCLRRARDGLMEYQRWNINTYRQQVHRKNAKWCKPTGSVVKLNFDAATNHNKES